MPKPKLSPTAWPLLVVLSIHAIFALHLQRVQQQVPTTSEDPEEDLVSDEELRDPTELEFLTILQRGGCVRMGNEACNKQNV